MDTRQITKLLDQVLQKTSIKKWFVIPRDGLRNELFDAANLPCAVFVNTNPSWIKSVGHWTVLLKYRQLSYFFDPLGKKCSSYKFKLRPTHQNNKRVQDKASVLCGLYCVLFAKFMTVTRSMKKFIWMFSLDTKRNDFILLKKLKRIGIHVRKH